MIVTLTNAMLFVKTDLIQYVNEAQQTSSDSGSGDGATGGHL
jgi:hypothetical protein